MSEDARINIVEFTVSELSAALKRTVEDTYGYVRVRGEITGYKGPHSSGHVYFALKDQNAKIDGVIWKGVFARMRIKPEDGLEVVVTGKLTTYPNRSSYQIIVETLEPAGLGALMALLEERKRKLSAEGLFDEARKQLLPFLPNVIGVVTSPTGAVIRDILHRLADRFPRRVLVWPVRVQGETSAAEVAAAIAGFNALPKGGPIPRPDLLIVARGGGSLEDLWSFNEEIVVRAAAESMIPLISAVGHETDVTLIDFAADKRAPTPTAAAEIAVPVRAELLARVDGLARRALGSWLRGIEGRRTELRAAVRALPDKDELLAIPRQRLDAAAERLKRALRASIQVQATRYARIAARLAPDTLRMRVEAERRRLAVAGERSRHAARTARIRRRDRLDGLEWRLKAAMRANMAAHQNEIVRERERLSTLASRGARAARTLIRHRGANVARLGQLLAAFSYRGVLARGFALVRDLEGAPLRTAAAVNPGLRLDIEFFDGKVRALAEGQTEAPRPPAAPAKRRGPKGGGDPGQGALFGA